MRIEELTEDHCTLQDLEKIVQLINEAYWKLQEAYFEKSFFSMTRINLNQLKETLSHADEKLFILRDEQNIIVGVIKLDLLPDNAKFGLFAIDSKHQGKKLGNQLVKYVEDYARGLGKKKMHIEVFTFAKKLSDYYESLGYACTGNSSSFFHESCIKPAYQNKDKKYLIEMSKDLTI